MAILATIACSLVLFRGYRQERVRVLKWSAIFFGFLTLNNVALLVDVLMSPSVDLRLVRLIPTAIGTACLLYGFTSDLLWPHLTAQHERAMNGVRAGQRERGFER